MSTPVTPSLTTSLNGFHRVEHPYYRLGSTFEFKFLGLWIRGTW